MVFVKMLRVPLKVSGVVADSNSMSNQATPTQEATMPAMYVLFTQTPSGSWSASRPMLRENTTAAIRYWRDQGVSAARLWVASEDDAADMKRRQYDWQQASAVITPLNHLYATTR